MAGRIIKAAAATALVASLALTAPASAQETSSLTLDSTFSFGGVLAIDGTFDALDDVTGPVTVATDGAGDAQIPMAGLDIGDLTIATNLSTRTLLFTMEVNDGLPTDDGTPFTGYSWPILVDEGHSVPVWLGAGGAGTNLVPRTSGWAAVCTVDGGWSCSTIVNGGPGTDAVTWQVPFFRASPGVEHGSTIDVGSAYGAVPASFYWPVAAITAGLANADSTSFPDAYRVPGEILLGIATTGTPEAAVVYTATATLSNDGSFEASLPAPAETGEYTIYMKTCSGNMTSLTCIKGTGDITV